MCCVCFCGSVVFAKRCLYGNLAKECSHRVLLAFAACQGVDGRQGEQLEPGVVPKSDRPEPAET
jgi:hypothetical protein